MLSTAYVCGVLYGDGYATDLSIGLRVSDLDFACAFADALARTTGLWIPPRRDGDYWAVRTSNKTGIHSELRAYVPQTLEEKAAWVRGLFDSEGNAQCRLNGVSENSTGRRVAMYSTELSTLDRAAQYLAELGIETRCSLTQAHLNAGHKGTKPVYELSVRGGKENYTRFVATVGSSIARKHKTLIEIIASYRDMAEYTRTAQAKGAATRRKQAIEVALPQVVAAIRQMIADGIKPTQRNCHAIPGYHRIQGRYKRHSELVALAME